MPCYLKFNIVVENGKGPEILEKIESIGGMLAKIGDTYYVKIDGMSKPHHLKQYIDENVERDTIICYTSEPGEFNQKYREYINIVKPWEIEVKEAHVFV